MAPRANVRLLTIRSANSCKQEGQPFRLPQPHPADALTSSITAALAHCLCAARARIADQNGVQFGQPVHWLRRRPPRRLRPPRRCCRSSSRSSRRPGLRTAVPSRRARTGSARGSASATEPPGRPGFGRRGSRTPAPGGPRQPRSPEPLARPGSHRAGAVSAIHSGLLTTSSQNLDRRQKTCTLPSGPCEIIAAWVPGPDRRSVRCQPGPGGRAAGLARMYRRSGSPATMISGAKATVSSNAAADCDTCHTA